MTGRFTPEERRWLVAQSAAGGRTEWRRCVSAGDDAACLARVPGLTDQGQDGLLRQARATRPIAPSRPGVGRSRRRWALVALAMLLLTFTPAPDRKCQLRASRADDRA